MSETIIYNGTFVTLNDQDDVTQGALAYNNHQILKFGTLSELTALYPKAKLIDADNRVVFPGFVNAHGHYYGMFSRGMDLKDAPAKNFEEILQRLWFRLDRCLDKDSVESSTEVCVIDALKAGTTTIVDHHASPNYILGSLKAIYDVCAKAGIRSSLCYEVTDRNGQEQMKAGVQENIEFMKFAVEKHKDKAQTPIIQAQFGLHALLTCSDETLKFCNEKLKTFIQENGLHGGFHIHVGEGTADQTRSIERTGKRVVDRLVNILFKDIQQSKTILAHCIDLTSEEIKQLAAQGVTIAHNPMSNMNNAVGVTKVHEMLDAGILLCLGTDGMHSDMVLEHKSAYVLHKHNDKDPQSYSVEAYKMLKNNGILATKLFNGQKIGVLEEGAVADIVITKYRNPTPMNKFNIPWHLMFGVQPGCAYYTICQGKVLVEKGEVLTIDEAQVQKRAQSLTASVWGRLDGVIAEDKMRAEKK